MHVTFHGAVREVTGSMHIATTKHDRILFDCGMFQGRRKEADLKNRALHFDPRILTNMILSHAHIDHSGRIPLLTKTISTGASLAPGPRWTPAPIFFRIPRKYSSRTRNISITSVCGRF